MAMAMTTLDCLLAGRSPTACHRRAALEVSIYSSGNNGPHKLLSGAASSIADSILA